MTLDAIQPETVDDAMETIHIAIALGMPVPAPVGSFAYIPQIIWSVDYEGRDEWVIGYYQTEEESVAATVVAMLKKWGDGDIDAPWRSEDFDERLEETTDVLRGKREAYFANHDDIEIIEEWLQKKGNRTFGIPILKIDMHPESPRLAQIRAQLPQRVPNSIWE
jgi:hypothetical protein